MEHTKGIGTLIQQRGPEAHAEGWDAAMLLSFRGIIVCSMFLSGNKVKDRKLALSPGQVTWGWHIEFWEYLLTITNRWRSKRNALHHTYCFVTGRVTLH